VTATLTVVVLLAAYTAIAVGQARAASALLSQGRPVTASSVENAGTPASAAVDGNAGTRWSSAFSDPQWLRVDLGATAIIDQVVLQWEVAYGKAFQIQVSTDASTWTSIYSTTTGTGGTQTLDVTGTGRYVRMYGTARGTAYGYSFWEFAVRTTATTATGMSRSCLSRNGRIPVCTTGRLRRTTTPGSGTTTPSTTWRTAFPTMTTPGSLRSSRTAIRSTCWWLSAGDSRAGDLLDQPFRV
jgi:beta-glucosidase